MNVKYITTTIKTNLNKNMPGHFTEEKVAVG